METYELFLKYVPVLIVLTPLVGVLNAGIVRLLDRSSLGRTVLPNLCLTTSLLLILLFAFDYGPHRSSLFVAESLQFFSRIELPFSGTDDQTRLQFAFGTDGLSLPLIAMIVLVPMVTIFREKSASNLILSLCLQSSLLAVVTTLDWRMMCGGLFASALLLRLILARSLPVGTLRRTGRWSQLTFFGDVLLAGGTMYFFLLASNSLQSRGDNYSTVIVEMRDFFARIEFFQESDSERVAELILTSATAIGMIVGGVLLRLPLLPGSFRTSSSDLSAQRIAAVWIWLYGPVIAVSFATRAIQLNPETAYACLAPFRAILIVVLLILGLVSSVTSVNATNRARLLLSLKILLVVGLSTPNPISLAGMYVLLGFLPFIPSGLFPPDRSSNVSGDAFAVPFSAIPVVLGSLLILAGVFVGSGSGARGLLELLMAGSGLSLLVLSQVRFESTRVSLIIPADHPSRVGSELPTWEQAINVSRKSEHDSKLSKFRLLTRAVLLVGLLMLPQHVWQRIRWDIQKVEFPVVSSELHFSLNNSPSRDKFTLHEMREEQR